MTGHEIGLSGRANGYVPLVAIVRGDVVESVHHGAISIVTDAGLSLAAVGDPATVTFLRSAAKPIQVLPLLAEGTADRLGLTTEEIAVIIGSHGGEPRHLDTIRSILKKTGLDESALQCGSLWPMHRPAARALRAGGHEATALHNNCSGKHAGMLALTIALGSPVTSYLEQDHPVQVRIRAAIRAFADLPDDELKTAVDGCSAPTFALPLNRAALAYARLLAPGGPPGEFRSAAERVVAAMREHPFMIAGTDRLCTTLMEETGHRLVAKIGAEGFYGLGYERDGRGVGIAIKVADGDGSRARHSIALRVLEDLGILSGPHAQRLHRRFVGDLTNCRGLKVGRVRTLFDLDAGDR
ncbi:MAG: asparaginase [Acidobacteria bacterium]|nr:asparaginase [Acidobacteriota bacterium]